MQPDGTYRLIEAVGSCQVGTVWKAVDAQGRSLSVAVLDATVAADQRWRDMFAAAAYAMGQGESGGTLYLDADFSAETPWVACEGGDGPGAERVFLALGMEYHPAPASGQSAPGGESSAPAASGQHQMTVAPPPCAPGADGWLPARPGPG